MTTPRIENMIEKLEVPQFGREETMPDGTKFVTMESKERQIKLLTEKVNEIIEALSAISK